MCVWGGMNLHMHTRTCTVSVLIPMCCGLWLLCPCLQFTERSDYLLVTSKGGDAVLLEIPSGNVLIRYEPQETATVGAFCFAFQESIVVGNCGRNMVQMWRAQSATTPSKPFMAHTGDLRSLCVAPQSGVLMTVGSDKLVKFWKPQAPTQTVSATASEVVAGTSEDAQPPNDSSALDTSPDA
eukprot:m.49005 g.49005  ORF g.49005 m.49005 type:complete len:182 (+) comp11073_c0_seq4:1175-1720(+)